MLEVLMLGVQGSGLGLWAPNGGDISLLVSVPDWSTCGMSPQTYDALVDHGGLKDAYLPVVKTILC